MQRMKTRVHLAACGLLGTAVVLLSGCSGIATETLDDIILHSAVVAQPGDEAIILGTVALTPQRCVGIEDADGVIRAVVWPDETQLVESDPVRMTVGVPDDLMIGDEVAGAGGYYESSDDLASVAQKCGAPDEVIRIRFEPFSG